MLVVDTCVQCAHAMRSYKIFLLDDLGMKWEFLIVGNIDYWLFYNQWWKDVPKYYLKNHQIVNNSKIHVHNLTYFFLSSTTVLYRPMQMQIW